jgi:hypothetical protein
MVEPCRHIGTRVMLNQRLRTHVVCWMVETQVGLVVNPDGMSANHSQYATTTKGVHKVVVVGPLLFKRKSRTTTFYTNFYLTC